MQFDWKVIYKYIGKSQSQNIVNIQYDLPNEHTEVMIWQKKIYSLIQFRDDVNWCFSFNDLFNLDHK